MPGTPATSGLRPTRRRGAVGDSFVRHPVEAGSGKAARAPEASADVTADPEGISASGLGPSLNEREIDVFQAIAVEGPQDTQDVITGILEGVHHFTWHKNGISRTDRQSLIANLSRSSA